jgi:hypothetical protein
MNFSRPLRSELQARLEVVRAMEKLRSLGTNDCSDEICPQPQHEFHMSGLFGLIPGSDTSPLSMNPPDRGEKSM